MSERTGKYLTFILRRNPEHIGCSLDSEGWMVIDEMLDGIKKTEKFYFSRNAIDDTVEDDSKKRFEISEDGKKIRCLQGHKKGLVNITFEEKTPPNILYHGTSEQSLNQIIKQGLISIDRDYVHLTDDLIIAEGNGGRWGKNNKSKILIVDAKKMHEDGILFKVSKNNVWLVENVAPKYISVKKNEKKYKIKL